MYEDQEKMLKERSKLLAELEYKKKIAEEQSKNKAKIADMKNKRTLQGII